MLFEYKQVRGKVVLIPSLILVQRLLPDQGFVDTKVLRKHLLEKTEAVLVCPVTLRKHLKFLGRSILKK